MGRQTEAKQTRQARQQPDATPLQVELLPHHLSRTLQFCSRPVTDAARLIVDRGAHLRSCSWSRAGQSSGDSGLSLAWTNQQPLTVTGHLWTRRAFPKSGSRRPQPWMQQHGWSADDTLEQSPSISSSLIQADEQRGLPNGVHCRAGEGIYTLLSIFRTIVQAPGAGHSWVAGNVLNWNGVA